MSTLPEYDGEFPNLSGSEPLVEAALQKTRGRELHRHRGYIDIGNVESAFSIALHMHQPLVPAGGDHLPTARVIGNLEAMLRNTGSGDNHNAPVFLWCYKRMGELIPQLVREGRNPRVMLEYSGTLLHGLRQMGAHDVIDALKGITQNPDFERCVEWLGMPWGHPVAPSTPAQDFRLHVQAFQHHFAAIFGLEAAGRLRGFSPSEMALPNHPDVAYAFVKTLRDAGYEWILVQEHTVELAENGWGLQNKHVPHRLVCRSSTGDEASIVALVKTQGSDTKLVAQMQPYYEAKSLRRTELGGVSVPPLVTQIADGENGGVMMNEFPQKFVDAVREYSGSRTPGLNGTEYLEHVRALGVKETSFPVIQPLFQHRIWSRMNPGDGAEKLAKTLEILKKEDTRFHMEGGSWTNNLSWVRGYENVLGPMEKVSAHFSDIVAKHRPSTQDGRYKKALFHLLTSQTSCYRYWGQGHWTEYGRELCRRADDILKYDF
jgi:hypothetical protein